MLAVLALVALRLSLGCHFLYEGLWKVDSRNEFKADPFLTQAKGPIAPLFYLMIDDINGRRRLQVEADASGKPAAIDTKDLQARWEGIRQDFIDYYQPDGAADEAAQGARKDLADRAGKTLDSFKEKLDVYLAANLDDIAAHFASLDRFENDKENHQTAPFQKQRRWDRMLEMRAESSKWLKDLEAQETAYVNSLYSLLNAEQMEKGQVPPSWNPLKWKQSEQVNFAVTWGLTAIGFCLMLGFFTPLAALGGAAFMCFVVMTQPAFPTIYPHDPPVVGHAILINKDFVEMVALLVISATSAGRWCGLDYFLYQFIINPFLSRKSKKQAN